MGLFRRGARAPGAAPAAEAETRSAPYMVPVDSAGEIRELINAGNLPADVTFEQALALPAVFAAVNFFTFTLASLPVRIFDGKKEIEDHPIARLLNRASSEEATAFDTRSALVYDQFGPGRGFLQIERDASGDPVGLYPLEYGRWSVRRTTAGRLMVDYVRADGRAVRYRAGELVDLSFRRAANGVDFVCPVRKCGAAIRQGLNASQYGLNAFGKNGLPPLALEGPHITAEGARNAASQVAEAAKEALEKVRQYVPLPAGFKFTKIGSDPDKMQLTPAEVFAVQQTARIYNLPPIFLQELSTGTYSNTEQQDLHLVKHTLSGRAIQASQELTLKLFGRESSLRAELDLESLTRGVFRERIEALATAINSGQLTPNEARRLRGEEALQGGDELFMQSGTVPIAGMVEKMAAETAIAKKELGGADEQSKPAE